jgi:WD40 repeat protein
VEGAHDRAIHCIALPQPSIHASVAPDNLNLFATAAIDNVINLWDVRGPNAIGRFSGHVNRREDVQCAFSPCMRYLATGSEDRSARIVDLRSLREVGRVGQGVFRDVVAGVAFHPLSPQLAACSFDGKVRFFGPGDATPLII